MMNFNKQLSDLYAKEKTEINLEKEKREQVKKLVDQLDDTM